MDIFTAAAAVVFLFLCIAIFSLFRQNQRLNREVVQSQTNHNTNLQLLQHRTSEYEALKQEILRLRAEKDEQISQKIKVEAANEHLTAKLAEQENHLIKIQEKLQSDFELLARRIFEEKSEKFTLQNKTQLAEMLNPLRERIGDFEKKIEHNTRDSIDRNSRLLTEIKQLKELNQILGEGAENLTRALTGSNKMQGDWGEMILERILENSGLIRDREFHIQTGMKTEDGKNLRPDVVIRLPSGRAVVIDSKVSLVAYQRYVNEELDENRPVHLRDFLTSCNSHVVQLSKKGYQNLHGASGLDFVLMFIPIEPAFMLALQKDQGLFNSAYEKGIVLVSPSNLIAALKIIAAAWKYEHQNQNAIEIADQGRRLYEKFVGFTEEMLKTGELITRAKASHDDAISKLSTGRGNLVSRAEKLQELGIKSEKQINAKLRDPAPGAPD